MVSALVKHMLQRNMFLFGFVDITDGSATEMVNEVSDIQNARVQVAYKKYIANLFCFFPLVLLEITLVSQSPYLTFFWKALLTFVVRQVIC